MGKKSQQKCLDTTYEERIKAAVEKQKAEKAKMAAQPSTPQSHPSQGIPNVDIDPKAEIENKTAKTPQLTFRQKIDMMRERRRRKSHRQKAEWQGGPMQEVPKEPTKPALLTTPFPTAEAKVGIVTYRCKDCKETFETLDSADKCISCDSKNIEIVELKTATKVDSNPKPEEKSQV